MDEGREKHQRATREYFIDVEKFIEPKNRRSFEMQRFGQDWGLLAIKNAFIANAAAAGAIPIAERIILAGQATGAPTLNIAGALWWFAGGVICAAATCFFAYLNFGLHSNSTFYDIADDHSRLIETHFGEKYTEEARKSFREGEAKADRHIGWTYLTAIAFGILSYLFFFLGVYRAIPA